MNNAKTGATDNVPLGETVLYACEESHQKKGGAYHLTCHLNDIYEAMWTGAPIVCSKGNFKTTLWVSMDRINEVVRRVAIL